RLQVDILLGDVTWETSYGLPGEGMPPRVRADITLDWPTWSQTAYRSWSIGEPFDEQPEILAEIVLRVQRLARLPDLNVVLAALPAESPALGTEPLERSGPSVEQLFKPDLDPLGVAMEVSYESSYQLDESVLQDGSSLDRHLGALGRWIASKPARHVHEVLEYLHPRRQSSYKTDPL